MNHGLSFTSVLLTSKDWQLHHARQLAGLQAFVDEEPKAGNMRLVELYGKRSKYCR